MGVLLYKEAAWGQAEAFFLRALHAPAAQSSTGAPRLAAGSQMAAAALG